MTAPSLARPPLVPIERIVASLASRAAELAAVLLSGGHRSGDEWCVPASASPFGCSVSVHLHGSKAGIWSAWAAGEGGDALDLVAAIKFAGDKNNAVRWALSWTGIDGREPGRLETTQRAIAARQAAPVEPEAKAKRNAAFRLWLAASPLAPGDAAFDYLSGTRGIDLAKFAKMPGALRFFHALSEPQWGEKWPALVAGVVDHRGQFLTIHRTWLERQADGRVRKAPVADPKKVYGPFKGGTIHLARGASGKAWKDAPSGDVLGLCEGIEDALTYAAEVPEHRVACAINVENMVNLVLPPAIGTLIVAADNDVPGSAAERTLAHASVRFQREGREVRVARCPLGIKGLNALLLSYRGGAP